MRDTPLPGHIWEADVKLGNIFKPPTQLSPTLTSELNSLIDLLN